MTYTLLGGQRSCKAILGGFILSLVANVYWKKYKASRNLLLYYLF